MWRCPTTFQRRPRKCCAEHPGLRAGCRRNGCITAGTPPFLFSVGCEVATSLDALDALRTSTAATTGPPTKSREFILTFDRQVPELRRPFRLADSPPTGGDWSRRERGYRRFLHNNGSDVAQLREQIMSPTHPRLPVREHLVGYPFAPHHVDVTAGDHPAVANALRRRGGPGDGPPTSCCTAKPT